MREGEIQHGEYAGMGLRPEEIQQKLAKVSRAA
jgi:hypothetical protein